MKYTIFFLFITFFFLDCSYQKNNPEIVLDEYINAANEHNIEEVRSMYSDSIIWYFGPFTFSGKEEAIQPLLFDKGANTLLTISNVKVNCDTVNFDLLETNDVLTALGVPELHHFPTFIINDGLIQKISSSRPPLEFQAYSDSVRSFAIWLAENSPEIYIQFWPNGNFDFSEETGRTMPVEVRIWRQRFKDN